MFQLLQERKGVVFVQEGMAMGLVWTKEENCLTPFLLDGVELFLEIQLTLSTMNNLLDGWDMAVKTSCVLAKSLTW